MRVKLFCIATFTYLLVTYILFGNSVHVQYTNHETTNGQQTDVTMNARCSLS